MAGHKRQRDEACPGMQRDLCNKADNETVKYFIEIREHLKTLDDHAEKQLLADNVLEETSGKETEIATDAECSRVVEALIAHASLEKQAKFLTNCVQGDNLGSICTSGPFGSHVLEKALVAVGTGAASADEGGYAAAEAALTAATNAAAANLYDMITSKCGSFVARRLLCVLCGREVSTPPPKRQTSAGVEGEGLRADAQAAQARANHGGLSARVEQRDSDGAYVAEAPFPHLVERVAAAVLTDEWSGHEVASLQCDAFAGPFLQSLLRACAHNDKLCGPLALQLLGGNPAAGTDSVTPDALLRLLTDRNGSHLMEAVFEIAPEDIFNKLCTAAFRGRVPQLAHHPSANFALQAALAALRRPQQLKRMFEDLRPHFAALLRARRGGVVTVLLAAAGRLQALQADCAAAVWHAVEAGLCASGATPLHTLLTLDTTTTLGEAGAGGRLSPLGCAALVSMMRYPADASKLWADALAALGPPELAAVAKDPGGCRVIEAFLEGPGGGPRKRRRTLQTLAGNWAAVAMTGAGSRFVENCYALAEPSEQETITAELAVAEQRLASTYLGPGLLRACHVDAFKADGGNWQRRVVQAQAARREFEDIFADDSKQAAAGAAEPEAADEGDANGEAERKAKRKAEKRARKEAATARTGSDHGVTPDSKKKGRKREVSGEEVSAVDAVLAQIGVPAAPNVKLRETKKDKHKSGKAW